MQRFVPLVPKLDKFVQILGGLLDISGTMRGMIGMLQKAPACGALLTN